MHRANALSHNQFPSPRAGLEILSCLIVVPARRGMSDVGGSLLCIWHCAVDNISINCGYAKGLRRSLIRAKRLFVFAAHNAKRSRGRSSFNELRNAGSGSVPRRRGVAAGPAHGRGSRRERVGTPVFTVERPPRRDDAALIVLGHPRRAAAWGSHDRGTGPRARRDRRGAHQRRRGAHQRHHTRTAQSESYVVT